MYKLSLSNKAHKELKNITDRDYLKISDKILTLENETYVTNGEKISRRF